MTSNGKLVDFAAEIDAIERRKRLYSFIIMILVFASLMASLGIAAEANSGGFWRGIGRIFDYPADLFSSAWALGWQFFTIPFVVRHPENGIDHTFIYYLIETVNMAVVATIVGFLLGAVFSLLASRNLVKNKAIVWTMRRILDITRAFPEIVIALFLIFIFGRSPLPAVLAIAFHTVGALGKLFSEVTENVDMKPWEGLQSTGANWLQCVWFGILPQVMPNWLSYALLRLEINVRASAIMGFVGAGGLGQQFKTFVDWKFGADILAIMILLILTIVAIDMFSAALRRRMIGKGMH